MEAEEIVPGLWIAMDYGCEKRIFYVIEKSGQSVLVSAPRWLLSSSIWLPIQRIRGAESFGVGTKRWWWQFMPWRDCVVPFKTPKRMWWA